MCKITTVRIDLMMFENVEWIARKKAKNGKAFVWAHNEHINNKGFGNFSRRNISNLGRLLKEDAEMIIIV